MRGAMKTVSLLKKPKKVFKGNAMITADTIPPRSATISGTRGDSVGETRKPLITLPSYP
jgi:hypothetical protein